MKPWAVLLFPIVACAGPVYNGYEVYYSTLPSPLFRSSEKVQLEPYSVRPEQDVKLAWEGEISGVRHKLTLDKGTIRFDKLAFKIKAATTFAGEIAHASDLGMGTEAYVSGDRACLENVPASASGSAVRHRAVYLILTESPPQFVKLPSLFASCLGIRLVDGRPAFDKIEYRYEDNQDQPRGVVFTEHVLRGKSFVASGKTAAAKFEDIENVYRFSLDTPRK